MSLHSLPPELASKVEAIGTVSDKIRLLDRHKYPRAEIAKILEKRYQHVRNVLERDAKKTGVTMPMTKAKEEKAIYCKVDADGTLTLPATVIAAANLKPGTSVFVEAKDEALSIASAHLLLKGLQDMVKRTDRGQGSVVDELIADRRREANKE